HAARLAALVLHVAMADTPVVLELLLGDLEGFIQHGVSIRRGFLVAGVIVFAADDDFLAGHADQDMHVRRIAAGLLALVRHFDRDTAADDVIVELLELLEMCLHRRFQRIGRFDIVKGKLEGDIHVAAILGVSSMETYGTSLGFASYSATCLLPSQADRSSSARALSACLRSLP